MAFILKDLLPIEQQLRVVKPHETVSHAIDLMCQQGYGQLPVVSPTDNFAGLVVTFESILLAAQALRTTLDGMLVRDVAQLAEGYAADTDLLRMLDHIERENFAVIVEGGKVIGIVTNADATLFFQSYAQDLMRIESIESRLKDAIESLFATSPAELKATIQKVTDRSTTIRESLPKAIRSYLAVAKVSHVGELDKQALTEAEKRLHLPKPQESLSKLSLRDLIDVLLTHENAPRLSQSKGVEGLRDLLYRVREARNKLAHFQGELSPEERRVIRFTDDWLEKNLLIAVDRHSAQLSVGSNVPCDAKAEDKDLPSLIDDDRSEAPTGSYAKLAEELRRATESDSVDYSFKQIEELLDKELPRSAYEYRAWWANDPEKPQSSAWLDEGWKTKAVSMTDQRLTFERTREREEAYIRFFASLNNHLAAVKPPFILRNTSPTGQSWHPLANIDQTNSDSVTLIASVARGRRLRVEIYIDYGSFARNKKCFDFLFSLRESIEKSLGEPLEWERLDGKRACRIAVYKRAQISIQSEDKPLIDWATRNAVAMYETFAPIFLEASF